MSKSDPTPNAAIFLTDTDDEIRTKVRKATTDPIDTVSYDPENRPGVANLLQIYASLSPRGLSAKQIAEELFTGKKNQVLKEQTAELIIESTRPVRSELPRLLADHDYLVSCLRKGEEDALRIAVANWNQFKNIVGLSL
ncbi:hypothetical protein EV182_003960 [Spiromyces aspiralis]|uniref:Uncharacterized protein n=1 Tax=Spiromyces aspiralis TaxID=68401 RepID=A0ACC1HRU4_9FUNG|nr:hypothetical protein EV182_003960 [Spiromyces aspiralis]